jgi:uncharacterized protein (DUF1800 family)
MVNTGNPGDFAFSGNIHEPGPRTLLGRTFADNGEGQASAILDALAVHPKTANHIATKLARHFSSDDPPPAMVARIERAFLTSGGDLPTVYRAIIDSPEAWNSAVMKFRTPWDWTVASLRAVSAQPKVLPKMIDTMKAIGQEVWRPPSPAGWDDVEASWAAPEALYRRVQTAQLIANFTSDSVDARILSPAILGAQLKPVTSTAISRAESPSSALALMLASPEMLRR